MYLIRYVIYLLLLFNTCLYSEEPRLAGALCTNGLIFSIDSPNACYVVDNDFVVRGRIINVYNGIQYIPKRIGAAYIFITPCYALQEPLEKDKNPLVSLINFPEAGYFFDSGGPVNSNDFVALKYSGVYDFDIAISARKKPGLYRLSVSYTVPDYYKHIVKKMWAGCLVSNEILVVIK